MMNANVACLLSEGAKRNRETEKNELTSLTIQMGEFYIRRNARRGFTQAMVYSPFECREEVLDYFISKGFSLKSRHDNKMIFSWGEELNEGIEEGR